MTMIGRRERARKRRHQTEDTLACMRLACFRLAWVQILTGCERATRVSAIALSFYTEVPNLRIPSNECRSIFRSTLNKMNTLYVFLSCSEMHLFIEGLWNHDNATALELFLLMPRSDCTCASEMYLVHWCSTMESRTTNFIN